ncbi:MAG: hypothetical protein P8168_06995 [Deltaproteobacteria bacterium]|jgi:hypothetical protein
MLPEIYDEMLHKLMKRTMKGEVHWKPSHRGDMFTVHFRKFSLSMTRGVNYVHFVIADTNDQGVDEFRVSNTEKDWDKIAAFYNQIRINSPDVNNAVKAIMEELEGEGAVGAKEAYAHSDANKRVCKIAG